MSSIRAHGASAVLFDRLYVIGGHESRRICLKSVEYYSSASNTWTPVAPMNFARSQCQAGMARGCLYVLGGRIGHLPDANSHIFASIERYDPLVDQWTVVNTSIYSASWSETFSLIFLSFSR